MLDSSNKTRMFISLPKTKQAKLIVSLITGDNWKLKNQGETLNFTNTDNHRIQISTKSLLIEVTLDILGLESWEDPQVTLITIEEEIQRRSK